VTRAGNLRNAAGLAVLAPLVAETIASSNTPAVLFPVYLPLLVLVYGLPAVLVRELWARARVGWPGFLALGVAYTALNEGVVAATWFKLDRETLEVLVFSAEEAGRAHGVNWAVAANLTVYHTFWSMLIPIVLMEAWARRDRGRPWLPRWAVVVAALVVAFVVVGSLSGETTDRVCEGPTQRVFDECARGRRWAALLIALAVAIALLLPKWRVPHRPGSRPGDRAVVWIGVAYSLAFLTSFFVLPLSGQPRAAEIGAGVLFVGAAGCVLAWAGTPGWSLRASVLLATGAMLPGMILSIRGLLVLQPVAVGLYVWFFLRPLLRRSDLAHEPFE